MQNGYTFNDGIFSLLVKFNEWTTLEYSLSGKIAIKHAKSGIYLFLALHSSWKLIVFTYGSTDSTTPQTFKRKSCAYITWLSWKLFYHLTYNVMIKIYMYMQQFQTYIYCTENMLLPHSYMYIWWQEDKILKFWFFTSQKYILKILWNNSNSWRSMFMGS
jgi:hypothetical protein